MPRGDKSKYTDKQKRKADHIAQGYEQRGVPEAEAESRAWATVNKEDGGGKAPGGSGRAQPKAHHDHLAEKVKPSETRQEALIDEALEESFPASDPPSPKHVD